MFNQVGPLEVVVVLAIVLLIFGPKRLPSAGRALGRSMREFKDSLSGDNAHDEISEAGEAAKAKPEAVQASAVTEEPAAAKAEAPKQPTD